MGKLFKKSLAFCVAIALVFTLFAGTISVNAETEEKPQETLTVTLVVDDTKVEDGAAQVQVPLHITCSEDTSINAIELTLSTVAGNITNVVSTDETPNYTVHYGQDALLNAEGLSSFNTANLLITVELVASTINHNLEDEAYELTIDCRSQNAADPDGNALKMSYDPGYIRMRDHEHVLSETYSYDPNGHWLTCVPDYCDVEDYKAEEADHEWVDGEITYADCTSAGKQTKTC